MTTLVRGLAFLGLLCFALGLQAQKAASADSTHEQVKEIAVRGSTGHTLQTLGADHEGRILALAAPPRGFGAPLKDASGEIHILTADGKIVKTIEVAFHAQSLNVGP